MVAFADFLVDIGAAGSLVVAAVVVVLGAVVVRRGLLIRVRHERDDDT